LLVRLPDSQQAAILTLMLTRTRLATLLFCCAVIYGQAAGQSERHTSSSAEPKQLRKEQKATRAVPADFGDATLWLDPTKWVQYSSEIGAVRFNNVNKHVLGWMLSDKTGGIPTSAMKDMAIRIAVAGRNPATFEAARTALGSDAVAQSVCDAFGAPT